jgi:RNA polymerase sigma-70 factor (ECF subfamily)
LRRRGLSPEDAQDVTQEFFCRLIGKHHLAAVDRNRGSFRAFLLAAINHLLSNEWDKARALKRGGGARVIPLDAEAAEERYSRETPAAEDPERAFDRRWALAVLDRALARVRDDYVAAGKVAQFERLKLFLSDVAGDGEYAAHAAALGLEPGAVAVAVHRLRSRYREMVRDEIAQTVTSAAELKEEMRYLLACLA